ncbi:MAG TPA: OmpH family outer membrane protein [Anaeromyxobacteraceae bacterium]|nr:OmpH family outer membrane protein [Anaeromyxobacteraceae bacterium]
MRKILIPAALSLAVLAPKVAQAQGKIGYVVLQQAVEEVEEGKAAKASLKKEFDQKQKVLDEKQNELKKMKEDLEKQAVVMSDEAKREKQAEFDRKLMETQGLFVQMQKELSEREREVMRVIFDKMEVVIREIAAAEGFAYVFEKNAGLLVAPREADLTNELIRRYNARYKAGGSASAAPDKKKADSAQKKPATGNK